MSAPAPKRLLRNVVALLPPRAAIALTFMHYHGALPSLRNPRTFSEWIQHRKLYDHDRRYPELADKISAKEYVARVAGSEYVIPTIWIGENLPPHRERNWPLPYVLKASHGSGLNLFVRSHEDEDWGRIQQTAKVWLHTRHAGFAGEWLYSEIRPRLLVEPYQGNGAVLPRDYKFFVFGGRAQFIQVDTDRAQNHRRCFYDRNWQRQPFGLEYQMETRDVQRPATFEEMIALAEKLGADFDFVRVDLYEVGNRPLFGELTFYPGSGLEIFAPVEWDRRLGQFWSTAVRHCK